MAAGALTELYSEVMAAIDGEINAIAQAHEKIEIINHYFLVR